MAYKLTWSPAARDDLHDIVVFIARDNRERAMSFGYQLVSETSRLQEFPGWAAWFRNTEINISARSLFGHTGLSIESITNEGAVRVRAFGILL